MRIGYNPKWSQVNVINFTLSKQPSSKHNYWTKKIMWIQMSPYNFKPTSHPLASYEVGQHDSSLKWAKTSWANIWTEIRAETLAPNYVIFWIFWPHFRTVEWSGNESSVFWFSQCSHSIIFLHIFLLFSFVNGIHYTSCFMAAYAPCS